MVRQIKIEQIDDLMKEAVQELVQKTTLQWTTLAKKATPVKTGNLRNGWKTNIQKFNGTIINNVEYAEPVIYGTALPPSWGGRFRTRQNTIKGSLNNVNRSEVNDLIESQDKILTISAGDLTFVPTTKDRVVISSVEFKIISVTTNEQNNTPISFELVLR